MIRSPHLHVKSTRKLRVLSLLGIVFPLRRGLPEEIKSLGYSCISVVAFVKVESGTPGFGVITISVTLTDGCIYIFFVIVVSSLFYD